MSQVVPVFTHFSWFLADFEARMRMILLALSLPTTSPNLYYKF